MNKAMLKLAKNQANTKQHPELDFCYLRIIHTLHLPYHPNTIGHFLKN